MKKPNITVIGSLNMDMTVETNVLPKPGETIFGEKFIYAPGGKGNNQAVSISRLGADVNFIGCVGDDANGNMLKENLIKENISTEHITTISNIETGTALITLKKEENNIIVIKGANNHLSPEIIEQKEDVIRESDYLLIQLEIPLQTVEVIIKIANKVNTPVILNPAPATTLSSEIIDKVALITPNEHEIDKLFLKKSGEEKNAYDIMLSFPEKIIMTKGKEGVFYVNKQKKLINIPAYPIKSVDTTGAGDSFNAGLTVKLSEGENLQRSLEYAVIVGAFSTKKVGAQSSLPYKNDVERVII